MQSCQVRILCRPDKIDGSWMLCPARSVLAILSAIYVHNVIFKVRVSEGQQRVCAEKNKVLSHGLFLFSFKSEGNTVFALPDPPPNHCQAPQSFFPPNGPSTFQSSRFTNLAESRYPPRLPTTGLGYGGETRIRGGVGIQRTDGK